jgi:hypothetical protein
MENREVFLDIPIDIRYNKKMKLLRRVCGWSPVPNNGLETS